MIEVENRGELEAKFVLKDPPRQLSEILNFLGKERVHIGDPTCVMQIDHYFDTSDWDLYNASWSYRFREAVPQMRSVELKSFRKGNANSSRVHARKEVAVAVESFPKTGPIVLRGTAQRRALAMGYEQRHPAN